MEVKLKLSNEEHKELVAYCNLNDLLISSVVKDSFTTGFNIERYGLLNAGIQEKQVEKEVIVEKRVEIPVEVIKEVVKIEYVDITKEEFDAKMKNFSENLEKMFGESRNLEDEIKKQLRGLKLNG